MTAQQVEDMTATQLEEFIASHPESDYTLFDVREAEEYAGAHIPGGRLLPLMNWFDVDNDMDVKPTKHAIFYCRSGKRGGRSAQMAVTRGLPFERVYNLTGGIMAYQGRTLTDFPKIQVFDDTRDTRELLLRAMDLEKGAERFYAALAERFADSPLEGLIAKLEEAEEGHARGIYRMLEKVSDEQLPPFAEIYPGLPGLMLESGEALTTAVDTLIGQPDGRAALLELALELELSSYDLYRNLADTSDEPEMRGVLLDLAAQEQRHAEIIARGLGQLSADPELENTLS